MRFWMKWGVGFATTLLVVLFLMSPLACPYCNLKGSAMKTACLSNVKQQAIALLMYREDGNDRFPNRAVWIDSILPYVHSPEYAFHVPGRVSGAGPRPFGYAFNAALSRAKTPVEPEKVVATYDSTNPARNASDMVSSLPNPGRHEGKNHISYVDGHAQAVKSRSESGE